MGLTGSFLRNEEVGEVIIFWLQLLAYAIKGYNITLEQVSRSITECICITYLIYHLKILVKVQFYLVLLVFFHKALYFLKLKNIFIGIPFTSFSALIAVANTSKTVLNSSGESGQALHSLGHGECYHLCLK